MKINILLITYNHEKYIRQAIESILMQRFDGEVEIIVADDYSSDSTFSIIQSFEIKSPFKFRYLDNNKNLGHPQNYKRAFAACNGEYIAIMEGDDYWTNPYRLQKHIDFLNEHRECALSINKLILYKQEDNLFEIQKNSCSDEYYYITTKEMALWNRLGNLSACVIRKASLSLLNKTIYDLDIDDWLLGMALSEFGFLVRLNEAMSVYRIHALGQWSGKSKEEETNRMAERIEKYDSFFDYKYSHEFQQHLNSIKLKENPIIKKKPWKIFIPPLILLILKLLIPSYFINKLK